MQGYTDKKSILKLENFTEWDGTRFEQYFEGFEMKVFMEDFDTNANIEL